MAGPLNFIRDKIAPPRFLAFLVILVAAVAIGWAPLGWKHAFMTGFDIAAVFFLVAIFPVLRTRDAKAMKQQARDNDANRVLLLALTTIVSTAIVVAVGAELGDKSSANAALVVATLAIAWLFSNTVFALHYAFIFYIEDDDGGLEFPKTDNPDYGDFIYFAYCLGMTFQTSDVDTTRRDVRLVVTVHCLAAFVFNLGVLAFTINVLGG